MNFRPMSAEEAQSQKNTFELAKPGVYDFEVTDAKVVPIKSKNDGSEQIEFIITLYGADGERCGRVWDYLQFDGKTAWKLRHAMYSIGLGAYYEQGNADPVNFIGLCGKADIGFQKGTNGYKDKNVIKDYVTENVKQLPARASQNMLPSTSVSAVDDSPPHTDDDLPF